MHLFMAREAVDKHLQVAGALIDPKVSVGKKLATLPKVGAFYATWYLGLWVRALTAPRYGEFGPLAKHLRFVERSSRKLAREIFHSMVVFRAGAERKQAFLFRLVDIANELFAMSASVSRAQALRAAGRPEAEKAVRMADQFCLRARREIRRLFDALWSNDDEATYRMGRAVLAGEHAWMEQGAMGLGLTVEELKPAQPVLPAAKPPPVEDERPLPPAPTAVPVA
jgi:hypothetical protein